MTHVKFALVFAPAPIFVDAPPFLARHTVGQQSRIRALCIQACNFRQVRCHRQIVVHLILLRYRFSFFILMVVNCASKFKLSQTTNASPVLNELRSSPLVPLPLLVDPPRQYRLRIRHSLRVAYHPETQCHLYTNTY